MLFPNKLYSLQKTVLKKSIHIIKALENSNLEVIDLYNSVSDKFMNIIEFQDALDLLFAISKIDLIGGRLCYKE
ncbi:MAG: ABC-three component system middle component 7 [Bacilli bacterium]|jgi:hypothetical protein